MGDGAGFIGDSYEHGVFFDGVPTGVVQDVQRPLVLINNECDHSNVVDFLGIQCLDIDFVSGKGRGKVVCQAVVILRDDGNLLHRLERLL